MTSTSSSWSRDNTLQQIQQGLNNQMNTMDVETTRRANRTITTTTTTTTRSNDEFFSMEDEIGQISALLDNSAAKHKISVRPARSKRSPSVPETKAKQEKEATIRELIETEEEFVRDLKFLITNYIRWIEDSKTVDGKILAPHAHYLFGGIQEIFEFHKTVLLEGMKYYAGQPNQIGRSFIRLERDFDKHANYIDRMEGISEFLNENPNINEAFYNRSIELNDTGRTLIDYIRLPSQRLNDYSLLLSDLIKISKQLGEATNDLEKGLELVNWIPSKSRDIKFIQSIEGFGDTRVGRILRHDWFRLNLGGREKERYCFLFKNKLLVTKVRRISPDRSVFILKNILQLPELQLVEIENSTTEGDTKEQGHFGLLDKEGNLYVFQSEASIANAWAKDVQEFTATRPSSDEPVVKKGRIISEVAESVTINGVEITDVTSVQDERSISIEKQVDTNVSRTRRVIDIPIQVESSDDTSLSERIAQENRKNKNLVDVIEIEHINASVKEEIREESPADKTQSLEESDENNETVEEQKELVSEQHDIIIQVDSESSSRAPQVVPSESPLIIEDSAVPPKASQTQPVPQESSASPESPEDSPASAKKSRIVSEDSQASPEESSTRPNQSSASRQNSRIVTEDSQVVLIESSAPTDITGTLTQVIASSTEITSGLIEVSSGRTEVNTSRTEVTSGRTEVTSGRTEVTSGRTEVTSGHTEVTPGRTEVTSGRTEVTSAVTETPSTRTGASSTRTEATSTRTEATSTRTEISSTRTEASSVSREESALSRKNSRTVLEDLQVVLEETTACIEVTSPPGASSFTSKYTRIVSEDLQVLPEETSARLEESSISRRYSRTASQESQIVDQSQASKKSRLESEKLETTSEKPKIQREQSEVETKSSKVTREKSIASEGTEVQVQSRQSAQESVEVKRGVKPSKSSSSANLIRMDSTSNEGDKPSFSLNVKSIEVEPGENAVLIVETNSSSPAIVTWLKENKPLDDRLADRVKIVSKENAHTLTLLNVRDDDSGLYTARCSNQFGTTCSSGFINVHEFTPEERQKKSLERMPTFIVTMKSTELLRDTTVCFIVKPTGDPEPKLTFFKDDSPLQEDDRVLVGRHGDLVELTIHNVTDSDVGTYRCVAKNKYGEATTSGHLSVTDEKANFPGLGSNLLEPGEEPEFTWYRDGVKFAPEDKFKVLFKDDEDSLALVFQHVRPEDAGLYTCVASTSSGRISCSAELTVQGAIHQLLREPEAPEITAHLTDTEVSAGGSAMLELKVTGFPKPDVAWFKDGVEIQAGGKYRFLYEDDESIALIIKGVSAEDAGEYNVIAKNDLGEATTTGRLDVNSPPKFKAKMTDTACMTEEPFTMSVTVHGSPEPQVKWYKDGQLIIESERIQMTQGENGVFTITFEKIKLEDGGAYSVVASNAIGQMSEFWNLVAHSRAKFTKTIEKVIQIKETETIDLSVEVAGNPEPQIKWSVGDTGVVGKGSNFSYTCNSRIDEKITVQCTNAFGTDECSADVKVLRGSKITEGLKDTKVKFESDAEFSVKVDEFPKGKVRWFIDGIEIDGKKYEKKDDGDKHTLKIKGVTESATVKVRAENDYGYDEQEARLDVIRKPVITRPLEESYTEVENRLLKLSVDISANPEPEVVWFHNGEQVDADARIKIHREGTETWSLTFNVLLPSDSGDWAVKSKNEAGEAESKTVVIVEGKPEFEKKLVERVECVESDSVAFEVKVRGAPAPVIQWSLNKEELTLTTRTSIETNNSTRSTTVSKLIINNTLLEDSGVITCVARNEHGECETTSQLIVQQSGPKLKLDTSPRIVEAGQEVKLTANASDGADIQWGVQGAKDKGKGGEFKLKPAKDCVVTVVASDGKTSETAEIPIRVMSRPKITGLKDVNAGPGETVTLSPKVESEPDGLEVAWYRGDEKVKDCKDGDYTLTLPNVSQADAGKYTLVAKNAVGETSESAKLNILVEPPSFTRGLADTKLREGDALTLRVRVIGVPEPKVTWELDGTVIVVEGKDGQYEIATESIQANQFGTYTVKAENVAGSVSTTGKVTLIEEKPIITKGPERSKTVDESEPFTLSAIVTGSPKPAVQWLKDGEPIKLEPGRVEVVSGPGDAQKLVIAKSEKLDDGVYTIEAKNPISVAKSAPSQVKVVPVPILPTVKITAPEETQHESEVPLQIEVGGEPSPKLTLYENDKQIEPIRVVKGDSTKPSTYIVKAPPRGTTVNYAAVVANEVGKGNDQVDIKLVAPPSAPVVIESLPAEKSAVDGTTLKLQSVISGSPLPSVQWLRDNVPVPCETKEVNGKLLTAVVLDGVGAADSGVYTLVAENPSGLEKQKCDVSVLGAVDESKPQEAPAFTTGLPTDVVINEGEDLVLTVGVSGNPLPEIQWGRVADLGDKDAGKDSGKGKPEAASPDQGSKPSLADGAGVKTPLAADAGQAEAGSIPQDGTKAALSDQSGQGAAQTPQLGESVDDSNKAGLGDGNQAGVGDSAIPGDGDGSGIKDGAGPNKAGLAQPGDAQDGKAGDVQTGTIGDAQSPKSGDAQVGNVGDAQPGKPGEGAKKPGVGDDAGKGKQKGAIGDEAVKGKTAPSQAADSKPRLEPLSSVLGPGVKVEESFDGKTATIRIPGVRQSMEGPISVQLSNPLGSKTETVNVGVRKVYSPAKIVDKFNDVHQVRGGDARFTAKVTGEPKPELEWKFEGKPLPADRTKYNTKWDGKTGSLTVYNVGDKDLGKYTLSARNIEGSDECSGVLKELSGTAGPRKSSIEKGEKPYFLKKIADTEFYEGMSVKFTACVGGFPEPEFHWFKDDMRIFPSGRITQENNDNGLLRLIINKAGPQDLGVYKLKIFNKHGEDECTGTCSIEDFQIGSGSHPDAKHGIQKPTGPPNPLPDKPIISSMTDRHLTLSWKPALRTHVDYPVTYTVEMCLANTNDWFKLRSGIKGCSTEVRNLEPGQDYKFRVRVENRIGISEPSPYAQTLRYKFDWKPTPWTPPGGDYDLNRPPHPGFTHAPKFLNKNTEQYGVPGCGIGVEWWLYGYPKPSVSFFFNGTELSSTDHVFDNNGRVVLYIDKLSESREGWYECIGVNEHGEDRYRIHVLQGEHPRWIVRLQETHILERRDGKLSGVVTGRPQPELKWYKDWNTLGESSRIKFSVLEAETGTYRVTCSLSDSIMKDHGLYSCAASNVVGTASSSANINIEEAEEEWRFKSYNKRLSPLSLRSKPIRDFYIFGDELGRGTQGITRHATSIQNGISVAVKSMESGEAHKRDWMRNEFSIHSELFHPGISRVSDGYQDDRFTHIVTDLCTGGDLISNCISRGGFSERLVADYIRQLLLSLDYLHNVKSIAHLGINPFDLLFSHEDSEVLKLVDFGLARRIGSRLDRLDYGQPEFASPEILNGEGAGYSSDLWSLGIVTYLLLNGSTPFLGDNDVETMNNVKKGDWELFNTHLSDNCQDFIRKLLVYDPRGRLDVRRALEHPWIARYFGNCDKKVTSSLTTYKSRLTKWYENASCRTIYRRNPWSGAYTHPSKMIYPPNEIDFEMGDASRDARTYAFGVPNYPRPDLNVEVGIIKSESHYQNGPDTYLLQLRDSGFPARLRQYMKVAASRSPSFALQLKSQAYDRNNPIIRERRRFQEVMDEEVKEEGQLTQGKEWRGEPRRLRHEVGIHLDTTAQADAIVALHKDGTPAFIREGPSPVVRANIGDNVILKCLVDGLPEPTVQWFKSDLVLGKTPRIDPSNTHLIIENFNETDYGIYKLTARNTAGSSTIKFRIVQGHYAKQQASNMDYSIETNKLSVTQESLSYTETIRDGNFGAWSLGSTSSGNLAQRISGSVDDLNLRTSLAHSGLLRLRSIVNDNDSHYLVYNESSDDGYMKLTDKYINDGVYNEADISSAVQQILSVMSYIQWRGLQLLNLNLDNILTDSHGNIKLFDTSSIVRVVKIGSILPIPATVTQYTQPELLSGDNVHMTTDVWSIGCLVYTLLSGCWPFAGDDGKQTKGNIQYVRYRFEPLYTSSTPEATRFLMMIFKKCPLKRPTIEEVQDSRWLSTQDSLVRRRTAASFKSLGLEKLLSSSSFIINN